MLFETFAVSGGKPTASSTGKVTSEPEPTSVLIAPAHTPAISTSSASGSVMDGRIGGREAPAYYRPSNCTLQWDEPARPFGGPAGRARFPRRRHGGTGATAAPACSSGPPDASPATCAPESASASGANVSPPAF